VTDHASGVAIHFNLFKAPSLYLAHPYDIAIQALPNPFSI
jgi:hypothetical protein